MRAKERLGNMSEKRTDSIDASPARVAGLVRGARTGSAYMYACARVMGSYISNRNVCAQTAQTWNLFNDDRCTLPENWTRMAKFDSEIRAQRARTISPLPSSR